MDFGGSILDILPAEELMTCFRRHKTEISTQMQEPHIFLNQLKDHNLVSNDIYEKVIKMKSKEKIQKEVYRILKNLEENGQHHVKEFWKCVFVDHILRKYPFLHAIQNKLVLRNFSTLPETENPTGSAGKNAEQEERGVKRKKGDDDREEEEEEDPGPSSVSSTGCTRPILVSVDSSEEQEEDSEEEEKEGEDDDGSQFEGDFLAVICGSISGVLDKERFTGSGSKSIHKEGRWFTPEEFVKQGRPHAEGHWDTDILCYGKTLKHLVQKKWLQLKDVCNVCNRGENVVRCTECRRAFHHHCHLPALQNNKPLHNWKCTFCLTKNYLDFYKRMNSEAALKSPVSGHLRCEYLLLHLYKDTQLMLNERYFTKLDQVKNKLQNNMYNTVKEFMQDVEQIYKPSSTAALRVKGEEKVFGNFKQNFQFVFKIQ